MYSYNFGRSDEPNLETVLLTVHTTTQDRRGSFETMVACAMGVTPEYQETALGVGNIHETP